MKCVQCFHVDELPAEDVCRRCSRNFTRTELVELIAVGLVYLFVCRFSWYLFTGEFFTHALHGGIFFRLAAFRDAFLFPVNLAEHPWHILTMGLCFALVVLIPVLVGRYYGAVAGAVLAVVGGYHVAAPFFFVPAAAAAVVAGRRFRKRIRPEAVVMLSAAIPMVYMFGMMTPALSSKLGVVAWTPWAVAAFLTAAGVFAVVRLAGRRDYNMRFFCWATAFAALFMVVLFYGSVGFSKIEYEFVRSKHWASSPRFRLVVAAADAPGAKQEERDRTRALFDRGRDEARDAFERFIRWFPRSPETAAALFERAEIHNLRGRFTGGTPDRLVPYTDRNTAEAMIDYGRIREEFSLSLAAVEARLRIGRYFLQHSQSEGARAAPPLVKAERELDELASFCEVKLPLDYRPPEGRSRKQRQKRSTET